MMAEGLKKQFQVVLRNASSHVIFIQLWRCSRI